MAAVVKSGDMEWKTLSEGIRARIVTGDRVTAQIVRLAKGTTMPPHRHPQEQLGLVLNGRARFGYGDRGKTFTVETGMFFFFAANEAHGLLDVLEETTILDIFGPARTDYASLAVRLTK
jgi:quercetin dioxygenase-like cupin family protein